MNNFLSIINTTKKEIQFGDDTSTVCCGNKSCLNEKTEEFLRKTEKHVEMKKLSLNTNKRINLFAQILILDLFVIETKFSQHKNVADTLAFKLTGTLVMMSS